MSESHYWLKQAMNRRRALRSAGAVLGATAALSMVGCGSDKDNNPSDAAAPRSKLDPTKGTPGGFIRIQPASYPSSLTLANSANDHGNRLVGLTHSSLVEFMFGTPAVEPYDISVGPDLAQALPEQPNDSTYIFKLQDARFQNGRAVTAEDVKYTFDRYAFWDQSAYKASFQWMERVETPDAKTVIVRTKQPFAEGLTSMAGYATGYVMAKEHEESPAAREKLMGSGPYVMVDTTAPLTTRFKKNPDYWQKPYPYFDEVEVLGTIDQAKQLADLLSRQTHMSYTFRGDARTQVKKERPDLIEWPTITGSPSLRGRLDIPPFNDKRVRQALSYALPRKQINDGVNDGLGEPDQFLTHAVRYWQFRKPSELAPNLAKYWNYDVQAAKQLLSAAGVTQPIQADYFVSSTSQPILDATTLADAAYREAGIANFKVIPQTGAQQANTVLVGNYEGIYMSLNNIFNFPTFGILLQGAYSSPPEGVKAPSQNIQRVNDRQLTALVDRQVTQLKFSNRQATLRQIEELFAEEQYVTPFVTNSYSKFTDPNLRNAQLSQYFFAGPLGFVRQWWWDKQPS